jgi:hypothetical protein
MNSVWIPGVQMVIKVAVNYVNVNIIRNDVEITQLNMLEKQKTGENAQKRSDT